MKVKNLALMAMMAAVLCVVGPYTIPIGPIPFSLVPLGIFITVITLGWQRGTISCLVYLCLGFVGLPVFSGGGAGVGRLLGPTGGFLVGYLLMALISGIIIDKSKGKWLLIVVGMVLGLLACYTLGAGWFSIWKGTTIGASISIAVIPFIIPDLIKVGLATGFYAIAQKQLFQYTR